MEGARRMRPRNEVVAFVAVFSAARMRWGVAAVAAAELRGMKKEEEEDFVLALQLQELWEAEDKEEEEKKKAAAAACPEASPDPSLLRSLSVVDEAWELLDPSPDVHGLFVHFNQALFWGRLAAVEVSWSPRMTLYAIRGGGRGTGRDGGCSGSARRAALRGEGAGGMGAR